MLKERRDKINTESKLLSYLMKHGYNITNKKIEFMIEKCFTDKESIYLVIKNKTNSSDLALIYFDHFSKLETRCRIKAVVVEKHNIGKNIATSIIEYSKRIKYKDRRDHAVNDDETFKKYEYIEFDASSFKYEGKLRFNM